MDITTSPYDAELTIESIVHIPIADPATTGVFYAFRGFEPGLEHFAVRLGSPGDRPLVRIHSECLTGDVFGSLRCDCGQQLRQALQCLEQAGGYLLYLRQEGRGIGLAAKLQAYALQDDGLDTFEANLRLGHGADDRSFVAAARMLQALDVDDIILLTNNPDKRDALVRAGVKVEVRPTTTFETAHNRAYLLSKRDRAGHLLVLTPEPQVPDSTGVGSRGTSSAKDCVHDWAGLHR